MERDQALDLLRGGADGIAEWNERRWRGESVPGLSGASLPGMMLKGVNLAGLALPGSNLMGADLTDANFQQSNLSGVTLADAKLTNSTFFRSNLAAADLRGANLSGANLQRADLTSVVAQGADFSGADLTAASFIDVRLDAAVLTGCRIYGISAWEVSLTNSVQADLVITKPGQPDITVDDLKVAQFVYLMLNNRNIREVIGTIGKKGVLILGRFTERKHILEVIKTKVRERKLVPMVFDFERPEQRDFSETVLTLAGISRFIIADITKPSSVPLELDLIVPNYMIPFVPLIQKPDKPFAMFQDLWNKHKDWVLKPLSYDSVDQLIRVFDKAVIELANERYDTLKLKKFEKLVTRDAKDYE